MIQETLDFIFTRFSGSAFDFISALAIGIFGWYFSGLAGNKVAQILAGSKFNDALRRLGWEESLARIDSQLSVPKIFGTLAGWWMFLFFLMVCFEIIGFDRLSSMLETAVAYFINIFIAAIIFAFAVFLVDFSQKIMVGSLDREKITYSRLLGRIIGWVIWTLAILAILYQLKIVSTLILVIFIGIVVAISLAAGIALGLGGKDMAAKFLKEMKDRLK